MALPLALAWGTGIDPIDVWSELGSAFGMLSIAMFTLQFLTSGRFETKTFHFSIDQVMALHKWTARILLIIVIVHPILFVVHAFGQDVLAGFDKFIAIVVSPIYRTGIVSLLLLAATVLISIYRTRLPLRYEIWRGLHLLAGYLAFVFAIHHTLSVGTYAAEIELKSLWLAGFAIVGAGLVFLYGIRPVLILKRLYEVTERESLSDDIVKIVLRPLKWKLEFASGQFAWITVWPRLLPIFDHPFSFSSSPKEQNVEFLIRNAGDFTSTLASLKVGTRVGLDGPHGDFITPNHARSIILVAGGIGISPILSIIKDLALNRDPRPVRLLYAVSQFNNLVALGEIRKITAGLNFQMLVFSEEGPHHPDIQHGRPSPDDFRRLIVGLPIDDMALMICGPGAMMASVSDRFEEIGLKRDQIYYEKFDYTDPSKSRKDRVIKSMFAAMFALVIVAALSFAWRAKL